MSRDDAKKEESKPVVATAAPTAPQTASLLDFDAPQATQQQPQQTFNPWGAQQQPAPAAPPVQAPPQAAQPQWESFAGEFSTFCFFFKSL